MRFGLSHGSHEFNLQPAVTLPSDGKSGSLAGFWLVQVTNKEEEANMHIIYQTEDKANKLVIPVMKNTVTLEPETKLLRYVPKKVSAPEALTYSPAKRRRVKG